jgi:polysaccharide biosynthesis/export protein
MKSKVILCLIFISLALVANGVAQATPGAASAQNVAKKSDAPATEPATPDTAATRVAPVLPADYVIGADDVLDVNVWREPDMTRKVIVRPDGMITLPVIGDVMAAGKAPKQLQDELKEKLKAYVSAPDVTVIVEGVRSVKFNIVGDGIAKPGTYNLSPPMTVLDAIALAGGLRDFAKKTKIYVLRVGADGASTKIPFNYKEVTKGEKLSQNIEIKSRDTIVVP